jgi:hypothetical protein
MAKAQLEIKNHDYVFITKPEVPATYGKVVGVGEELITVETTGGTYEIEPDFLEVDELPF